MSSLHLRHLAVFRRAQLDQFLQCFPDVVVGEYKQFPSAILSIELPFLHKPAWQIVRRAAWKMLFWSLLLPSAATD